MGSQYDVIEIRHWNVFNTPSFVVLMLYCYMGKGATMEGCFVPFYIMAVVQIFLDLISTRVLLHLSPQSAAKVTNSGHK